MRDRATQISLKRLGNFGFSSPIGVPMKRIETHSSQSPDGRIRFGAGGSQCYSSPGSLNFIYPPLEVLQGRVKKPARPTAPAPAPA